MKLIFLILFYLMPSWSKADEVTNKKTVCSITINSDNEIKQFKKQLDPKLWNFVELTENGNNTDWFQRSCEKKLQCDILVFSGHFAGSFFGSSNFRISMEDLESHSCKTECDGILRKPKEVFLFGCNTLAGKNQDHRSPQEYLQVLRDDGFSSAQALQIVAFRYSQYGNTFAARMSQVFTSTPRIYGFSSIAPTGASIESKVKNYLVSSKDYYDVSLINQNKSQLTKINTTLVSSIKNTSITQITGAGFSQDSSAPERPYCYLGNDSVSRLEKLKYIRTALESGHALTIIPFIKNYIHTINVSQAPLTGTELEILESLKNNKKTVSDFESLLNLKDFIYLKLRIDVIDLMKDLKILNEQQYSKKLSLHHHIDFSQPISYELKDSICSLDVKIDLNPQDLPEARWYEQMTYNLLSCLKPTNSAFVEKVLSILSSSENSNIRYNAAAVLGIEAFSKNFDIQKRLAHSLVQDQSPDVRLNAAIALQRINTSNSDIHRIMGLSLITENNSVVKSTTLSALSKLSTKIDSQNNDVLKGLISVAALDADEQLRKKAQSVLIKIKFRKDDVVEALKEILPKAIDKNQLEEFIAAVLKTEIGN